jgi:hypothetical protein
MSTGDGAVDHIVDAGKAIARNQRASLVKICFQKSPTMRTVVGVVLH